MTAAPEWLCQRPFAHRGLHDRNAGVPENSLAAFTAAVDGGYAIELDVQTSRDNVVMVFHDAILNRMTGAAGALNETDSEHLATLHLGDSQQAIPTLREVLNLVAGQVPLIVEIKSRPGAVGGIEGAVLPILRAYEGPFAVTSFEARSLAWFRAREPHWPRGHNVGVAELPKFKPWWRRLAWRYLYDVDGAQANFVVYDRRDLPNWAAKRARAMGKPLLSYTIKDAAEMERLAPHTDNIIFEGFHP
ncbi:MAG: glycerophosphodiester phosphodiesterase [Rhodospirillaceae bacterium]|jgi:glycerophosphoryl diester phosphodiesterase|nr:glycerophosphodiester phosphodiesterase [Rhodospirillaceae bacterium]MBT5894715.1 glycerophosphodiester phosphodiesterase [Rhodospirillaceae bacterium]MBT6429114.1 glycerophosphodiester phosphodiesterase [Rhodospirillaceae bacterium]MBT7760745.1 glycerophosphodiester phosphodiesterase [Rhodospirillaceae bacterium]